MYTYMILKYSYIRDNGMLLYCLDISITMEGRVH